MEKINLQQKLALFNEHWKPHVVGELNGQMVKVVKFKGPFTWHHHEQEDELFFVLKGKFRMEYRNSDQDQNTNSETWINQGEMIIVPRGVEHRPVADDECEVMLFEPAATLNTGNVENEFTVSNLRKI